MSSGDILVLLSVVSATSGSVVAVSVEFCVCDSDQVKG